jgi:ABC-type nitrate/sulfonate/bicarbonate transport system permease component
MTGAERMRLLQGLLPAIVIIGAWELGAHFVFDPRFVGQPSDILRYLLDEARRGEI